MSIKNIKKTAAVQAVVFLELLAGLEPATY